MTTLQEILAGNKHLTLGICIYVPTVVYLFHF